MKRRTDPPPVMRRQVTYTPAQLARQSAVGAELTRLARVRHPERYAPDGAALLRFAGDSWEERLASWRAK